MFEKRARWKKKIKVKGSKSTYIKRGEKKDWKVVKPLKHVISPT